MEQGFYDDAAVYDILHTPGTAAEVTGLERVEGRFAAERGAWLEPACGTGRYLRVAARRGRSVIGFDRAEHMVAYARGRLERAGVAERADVFVAEMTEFARRVRRPVSLAFNMINTVRHLGSDEEVRRHIGEVAAVLAPGGVYAVGLSTAGPHEQASEDVWHARRGSTAVTQVVQYEPAAGASRDERVVSHITVSTPRGERHIDSAYALRSYTLVQWLELVGSSALSLAAVVDEDGDEMVPGESGYGVYVLRKG